MMYLNPSLNPCLKNLKPSNPVVHQIHFNCIKVFIGKSNKFVQVCEEGH